MINKQKGTIDLFGDEIKKWDYVSDIITAVAEKYNYGHIRIPLFEASELYHRGVGETSDIVRKETYDFKDKGDRSITLRPEGTAGVARAYIENKMYGDVNQPKKFFYIDTMYRYERPQAGRDREFTQFGFELIGSNDPITDAEMISIPVNIYKMLGLNDIKVMINSIGDKDSRNKYKEALVDYLTPHLDLLCDDCKERIKSNPLRMLDCKVDRDSDIFRNVPNILDYLNDESKARFETVKDYLSLLEIEYVVDAKLVRGLDYYDHTVFEIEVNEETLGAQNVLGGGGRYNGLITELDGPDTPAVGFAGGFGRLITALSDKNIPIEKSIDAYVMYVSDTEAQTALYLSQELRMNGFKVELETLSRSLKAQFNQADRLNAKYLIMLNDADIDNEEVTIKDNKTHESEKVRIYDIVEYLDMHM